MTPDFFLSLFPRWSRLLYIYFFSSADDDDKEQTRHIQVQLLISVRHVGVLCPIRRRLATYGSELHSSESSRTRISETIEQNIPVCWDVLSNNHLCWKIRTRAFAVRLIALQFVLLKKKDEKENICLWISICENLSARWIFLAPNLRQPP